MPAPSRAEISQQDLSGSLPDEICPPDEYGLLYEDQYTVADGIEGEREPAAKSKPSEQKTATAKPSSGIPRRPEAPPQLKTQTNVRPFGGCKRAFTYRGKRYAIDSNYRQDGERLRPIIRSVPAAVSELDLYQKNRQSAKLGAYLGTIGLVTALATVLFVGELAPEYQRPVRAIGIFGGLGLAGTGFIYSFGIMRSNERHLSRAVENYNSVRSRDPIELQFSTGILF